MYPNFGGGGGNPTSPTTDLEGLLGVSSWTEEEWVMTAIITFIFLWWGFFGSSSKYYILPIGAPK